MCRYGEYSYEEIMLLPIAQAIATVTSEAPGITDVYFALQVRSIELCTRDS
jgi:hypothetical protein